VKRKLIARIWRKELDKQFKNMPRYVEKEKVQVGHLAGYLRDFRDTDFKVILSAWGYQVTTDGFVFIPEAEVSLLCSESPFYLKISGFFETFEFTDSDKAELWLLRRAETAYFIKEDAVMNFLLSLVVEIRTAKHRKEGGLQSVK
jgi:hypothetical protein